MDRRTTVVLADDHKMVADGLSRILSSEYDLIGTAVDGKELLDLSEHLKPDVLIIDISMPVLNGLDALRILSQKNCKSKIIILTMHADPELATEALRAGANGYLLKQSAGEELLNAVREVLAGHMYLSPVIAGDVFNSLVTRTKMALKAEDRLTPRQREILQLVVEGKTMKEAAAILGLSTRTAESHKYEMMKELGLSSTAELIQYAYRNGLVVR